MSIQLRERFEVAAPVEPVWDFLVDPRRVVACVPGGELTQVLDARNFSGKVRIRIGPLTLAYRGAVRLVEVDEASRRVKIAGLARESAGTDSARLTLESWLAPLPGGRTEVIALARVDVSGAVVELGRGMLVQLGHLVFQEFATSVGARIEAAEASRAASAAAVALAPGGLPPTQDGPPPLRALPLVLRALRAWIASALRRRSSRGSDAGRGAPAA
jgi:carbon monoxide dehydrogenase subunit G